MIYKLCCKNPAITDVYVGSTTNFKRRKQAHKHNCTNERGKKYHYNVYEFIRREGHWENWDMVVVGNVACENKHELHKVERSFIESLGASLNQKMPTNISHEYAKNPQKYFSAYWEDTKAKQNLKKYAKIKCECGASVCHTNMARHKKTAKHKSLKMT